jgi:uncharacterized membrane protein YfcA
MFMDVQMAVPLCMLNGLLITLSLSLQLRRHIDWRRIFPLLAGCLPGIFFGLLVLRNVSNAILQICLGLLIIGYALYSLFYKRKPGSAAKRISAKWAYVAGFFTGGISASLGAGGPPTIIYVTLTGWTNDEIKAALSIFFFISGVVTAIGHAASGLTTHFILRQLMHGAPFTVLGVWGGIMLYNRISRRSYIRIMLWILLAMGIVMLAEGFK